MTVTLIFWIAVCIGESCPIECAKEKPSIVCTSYVSYEYSDMQKCKKAEHAWDIISPYHWGVCLEGDDWRPDDS